MKHHILVFAAVCAAVLSSCTGDPTGGGIFWSQSMAEARLNTYQTKQAQKQAELDAAMKRTEELRRQKRNLQH